MNRSKPETRFVICIRNEDYKASLELRKIYRIIPDKRAAARHYLRVVDESGEDYLYSADLFVPIALPKTVEKVLLAS